MTDEPNRRAQVDEDSSAGETEDGRPMTKDDWEALATEPDNAEDLGYQLADWEQFEVVDNSDQVIFLPSEESELEDAAFLVAESEAVVDLPANC